MARRSSLVRFLRVCGDGGGAGGAGDMASEVRGDATNRTARDEDVKLRTELRAEFFLGLKLVVQIQKSRLPPILHQIARQDHSIVHLCMLLHSHQSECNLAQKCVF